MRAERIGTSCVQCGSSDPPMVLQHLWQPPSFAHRRYALTQIHSQRWQEGRERSRVAPELAERDACPRCGAIGVTYRKRTNDWRCNRQRQGRTCGHTFDHPAKVAAPTAESRRRAASANQQLWEADRAEFWEAERDVIYHQVVLQGIDDHLRYLSLVDTVTFCKRCAFNWDENKVRLCTRCRVNWQPLEAPSCRACDPDYTLCRICRERHHLIRYRQCYTCLLEGRTLPKPASAPPPRAESPAPSSGWHRAVAVPSVPRDGAKSASSSVGRNDACPCGSGRKFKKCCMRAQ